MVAHLTGGRGADHILEMAGGENLKRSIAAVAPGGRISVIGLLESEELSTPIMPLLASRASIVAVAVGPRRVLEDVVRMIDHHKIKPVIDAVYDFFHVPPAFEHLKRGAFGKIVGQANQIPFLHREYVGDAVDVAGACRIHRRALAEPQQ